MILRIFEKYRSTIKSRSFFYMETKKLCRCVLQGLSEAELKAKIFEDNLFQVQSGNRKKEIAHALFERLQVLDDFLMGKLARGDVETGKMIVLYSIMKTDRLFYEFMRDVFSDKLSLLDPVLADRDFRRFFSQKRQQSETVGQWTDDTLKKLKQVYIRILFEAGLLKSKTGEREMVRPLIALDVQKHWRLLGEQKFIAILTGD